MKEAAMSDKSVRETVAEWVLTPSDHGGGLLWEGNFLIATLPDRAFEYMTELQERAKEEA